MNVPEGWTRCIIARAYRHPPALKLRWKLSRVKALGGKTEGFYVATPWACLTVYRDFIA
jgi:hypothetical protein